MASSWSDGDEFGRAVAYALQRLDCESLQLKEEQEASLRAMYSGKDTLVWLYTNWIQKVNLLYSSTVSVRLQARTERQH